MNNKHKINLIIIFVLMVGLRFYRLPQTGLLAPDEGTYIAQTKTASLIWRIAVSGQSTTELNHHNATLQKERVLPISHYSGKPMFTFFISLIQKFTPNLPHWIIQSNALIGCLCLIPLLLLMKNLGLDDKTRLYSGLILTCSGFHLTWSRSAMPHILSIFFYLLSLTCYFYTKKRETKIFIYYYLSGIFAGLSFITHPNIFPFIISLLVIEGIEFLYHKKIFFTLAKSVIYIAGMVNILLLVYLISTWLIQQTSLLPLNFFVDGFPRVNYLQELNLHGKYTKGDLSPGMAATLKYYLAAVLTGEGGLNSILLFLTLGLTFYRLIRGYNQHKTVLYFVVLLFFPLLFYTLFPINPSWRNIAGLCIPISLLTGHFISQITANLNKPLLFIIIPLYLVISLYNLYPILTVRSGYQQMVDEVKPGNEGIIELRSPAIYEAYGIKSAKFWYNLITDNTDKTNYIKQQRFLSVLEDFPYTPEIKDFLSYLNLTPAKFTFSNADSETLLRFYKTVNNPVYFILLPLIKSHLHRANFQIINRQDLSPLRIYDITHLPIKDKEKLLLLSAAY